MFKWLLLIAGAGLLYLWIKGKKQAKFDQANMGKAHLSKAQSPVEPEPMVQCECCKVHFPKSHAIAHENRFYCSEEHFKSLDKQGWIGSATWRASPNQDTRPDGINLDLLVIHHISLPPGEFKNHSASHNIVDFFQNKLDPTIHPYFAEIADQKVSCHFLITRSGELIQFVSTHNRAWHAGASSFMGRERCNDFSIGVELEGDGDTPFESAQYTALASLVQSLLTTYPDLQFAGHSDIAPERKTDPGKFFEWKKFQKETGIALEKMPYGLISR